MSVVPLQQHALVGAQLMPLGLAGEAGGPGGFHRILVQALQGQGKGFAVAQGLHAEDLQGACVPYHHFRAHALHQGPRELQGDGRHQVHPEHGQHRQRHIHGNDDAAQAPGFRVAQHHPPVVQHVVPADLENACHLGMLEGLRQVGQHVAYADGLAAGVVFFAGVTNFVVASLMGTTFVAVVMATLAGAVLGFLFYNFNPARIFMGDSGSYFLGFILAVCSIAGPLQKASAAVSIAVPIAYLLFSMMISTI